MSLEDKVTRAGRVEYIEPNSLFITGDTVQNGTVQNGIPQPYEDYSFSVNLRVINGNRYDCGFPANGNDIAKNSLEFSSDKGTISFMDGTTNGGQSFLTTNFTDISMNNPETNTKECLGIERISIKFDSWYYPTVDIRFIDVRGASLMQPAEYEYYNNGGPNLNTGKNVAMTNSDFFKAFFNFPYPLFKLSVKGFYGKEVTYDLSVLRCNVDFNSTTGNFEINASFIGYMYGMYSDLPFPFIYVAPYIDLYGKNTWQEKIKSGDFLYLGTEDIEKQTRIPGTRPMYTFAELKTEEEAASEKGKKKFENSPSGKKRVEVEELIKRLEQNVYFKYPLTSTYRWWTWSKNKTENNSEGYAFLSIDNTNEQNRNIFNDFLTFSLNVENYNTYASNTVNFKDKEIKTKGIFAKFFKESKEYKARGTGESSGTKELTVSSVYSNEEVTKILKNNFAFLAFHADLSNSKKPVLVFDKTDSTFGGDNEEKFKPLIDELKARFDEGETDTPMKKSLVEKKWTIMAFVIEDIDYKVKINTDLNALKKEEDKLKEELDKVRNDKVEEILGFDPTIKNMYNMIFAHIDTFMSVYYNTLDRIRQKIQSDDDSRNYKKLCGNNIQVDVSDSALKSEFSNGGKLPPFTMFYKEETVKDSEEKKIVAIYPGDIEGGDKLDEVQLVEAIINATSLSKRGFEPVTPKHNIQKKEGAIVPITYYDVINNDRNPYLDILNEQTIQDPNISEEILRVFVLRCFYALLNGSYLAPDKGMNNNGLSTETANFTKKANLIAELEKANLERALEMLDMNPTESFLKGFHMLSDSTTEIIDRYVSDSKNPLVQLSRPIFSNTTVSGYNLLSYKWIKDGDYYSLPIGTFNHTTLINYLKDVAPENTDKFLKISSAGTINNDIPSCFLYVGGKKIDREFSKRTSGEFARAAKLFPNYDTVPKTISGLTFGTGTFSGVNNVTVGVLYNGTLDLLPTLPSTRRTMGGTTSIFMDPLYYAQTSREARAYMFLMGIPLSKDKRFFLPKTIENGDYPTLMLLREGAAYWRKEMIEKGNDPITYEYDTESLYNETEALDPCFGEVCVDIGMPQNASLGRKATLKKYFLNWAGSIVDTTVPTPSLTFADIEENLALWQEVGLTTKQVLSPEFSYMAVTEPTVDSFANAEILKEVYNVGADRHLGKIGKIRTDVYLNNSSATTMSTEVADFIKKFKKFYGGFDSVIDFTCLDTLNRACTVPRTAMDDAVRMFIKKVKDGLDISVEKLKENEGVDSSGVPADKEKKPKYVKNNDIRLACYIALKNIYDRWVCSRKRECWAFSCNTDKIATTHPRSDFSQFFYMDEYYNNVGMKTRPSLTSFVETTSTLGSFTKYSSKEQLASTSIMKILSLVAQQAGCALLTLPTMLGLARTDSEKANNNSIGDVFKAFPYNEAVKSDSIETSFIVLFKNQRSSKLGGAGNDSGKDGYISDGFDIANTWGKIVPQPMFANVSNKEDAYVVPCFGVTFAKQNQSFFKDIRLSMEDHQLTEYAMKTTLMIGYESNGGPRKSSIIGQDLYSVFSNYSYSCTVSMLGDAQITPLMLFQLNNIPMWKGAYLITTVHHEITNQGMDTVFTGVRMSRPSLPYVGAEITPPADESTNQTAESQPPTVTLDEMTIDEDDLNISLRPLDLVDVNDVSSAVFVLDRTTLRESDKWINGLFSVIVYHNNGYREVFQDIAVTIESTNGLKGDIKDYSPAQNEVWFSLPRGRYAEVFIENPPTGKEYRNPNDRFYEFTEGKHLTVSDARLGTKVSEIITGETDYKVFEQGGFEKICFGEVSPIMLYANDVADLNKQFDKNEVRATYQEIFNFAKRMNAAKKSLTFLINEKIEKKG